MSGENLAADIGAMLHGGEKEPHPETVHQVITPKGEKPKLPKKKEKPMDAKWEPIREEGFAERLKTAALGTMKPAALSAFFFWCQLSGKMDHTVALIAMFVCAMTAAFRLGRFCHGER